MDHAFGIKDKSKLTYNYLTISESHKNKLAETIERVF